MSILTPGPIVEEILIFLTNEPLTPVGLFLITSLMKLTKFSVNLSSSKEARTYNGEKTDSSGRGVGKLDSCM